MLFNQAEERFLTRQDRGHLATVGPDGVPQVKPVGFRYNQSQGTIDLSGLNMGRSAKYRNVKTNPNVAFVVDEVTEPTVRGAHFLEIRGRAETAIGPHDPTGHLAPEIIRIYPRRVVSFNVDPEHPVDPERFGFDARDVAQSAGSTDVA